MTQPSSKAFLTALKELLKCNVSGNLISTSTGDDTTILQSILDSSQAIPDRILCLLKSVLVRSFHKNSHRLWVSTLLNKGELVLPKYMLIHKPSLSQAVLCQLLHGVHGHASTSQGKSLHIPSLSSAQCHHALLGKSIKRERINTLLIYHNKGLPIFLGAKLSLKFNNFLDPVLYKLPLSSYQLLSVLG